MSSASEIFDEMLDCQEEFQGKRLKLIIGTKEVDALIEQDQNSLIQMGGGFADAGSYMAFVRVSDFAEQPAQGTGVKNPQTGSLQKILSATLINETWKLEIGEPAAEDE